MEPKNPVFNNILLRFEVVNFEIGNDKGYIRWVLDDTTLSGIHRTLSPIELETKPGIHRIQLTLFDAKNKSTGISDEITFYANKGLTVAS